MNETFTWECDSETLSKGKCNACKMDGAKCFDSIGDAARDALTCHPEHLHSTYVVGSKTGYKGTAYGLNFNGVQ